MSNEQIGENQENQEIAEETPEQKIERLRKERNGLKKENKTLKTQKSHWRKKAESKTEESKEKPKEKSNEPDYAQEAFLEGRGIKHPDDKKIVQDEAKRLKMSLTDILEFEHIKSKLKDNKDQREAEAGMPKGKGKVSGSSKQDVNYWIDKKNKDGTYETPDDLELAEKVIRARTKRDEQNGKFSDELYNG